MKTSTRKQAPKAAPAAAAAAADPKPVEKKDPTKRVTEVFARLLAAGNRLLQVIERNQGGANKDLAKFADQINSLCDKWDR